MIRFEAIKKTHKGSPRTAVSDLTLHVREGEICVFVGPSGCGKTTLLRMINRLDIQDSGLIYVNGVATDELDVVTLRRGIGFMMQSAALFPHQTVAENIGAVPRLLGWNKHKIRQRVSELISLVGLQPEFLQRYPNQLSGGQQSRVALARALASDPPVVLMDEPFAALDPVIRERLQDELVALQRRLHKTIILVTHDMEEAIKIGDRIAIFEGEGRLAQFDTPHTILARPASEFVKSFIGRDPLLKRLSLMKVSDLPAEKVSGEFKLLLDDNSNPLTWVSESDVPVPELATVSSNDSLHHALVKILTVPIGVVVRVNEAGVYEGCLSITSLHSALNERRFGNAQ
ncbi:ABC-type proline/glycine betaine transport system, ATPase component [Pseudomonas syringae pv. helianthi]|uniref:ABC-type proline/glycine betaine transport system, ATPase component n=1 Tax=Pseudomonas syringae pv. helianthi TaxID=251654 RepID=A0A0N8RME2_9PSED|nr:ABC transporter ATP-binding protein [Pseudomonas syringae group genomosp. 7]KPX42543.1 ABC-type proline/glycine betaine transport system, ATPase component [Pseudomonas syringae pv. helianthi]UNB65470.1 ABC transporter ATP-binding protein [Pseudomonas syringae pv. helianthi]